MIWWFRSSIFVFLFVVLETFCPWVNLLPPTRAAKESWQNNQSPLILPIMMLQINLPLYYSLTYLLIENHGEQSVPWYCLSVFIPSHRDCWKITWSGNNNINSCKTITLSVYIWLKISEIWQKSWYDSCSMESLDFCWLSYQFVLDVWNYSCFLDVCGSLSLQSISRTH